MSPISQEVAIGCKEDEISLNFTHSDKAGVGKRHRHTRIAFQVAQNFSRLGVIRKIGTGRNQTIAQQSDQKRGAVPNPRQ